MLSRSWRGLVAVVIAAATLAAPASAGFGDVSISAQTRVNLEAFGDGVPAGFEEFWNETIDGSAAGVASSSYDWPAPPFDFGAVYVGGCPDTGCATKEARAHASVDRAAGELQAAAVGKIGTGGFFADNAGYNQTFARAQIEDTITLSEPATVMLEGSLDGRLGFSHSHDGWYGDPRGSLRAEIGFTRYAPGGEWPYEWVGGLDEEYQAEAVFSCPYPSTCAIDASIPLAPQVVAETFSIPVELPAGETFFSASLIADVDMLVWGAQGDVYRSMHVMSTLVDFANTATFTIRVPDHVVATSGSGELPIVGGAAETPDTTPPTVVAPADVVAPNDPGVATAVVDPGAATATDDNPGVTVDGARSDGLALDAPYPVGTTTITWTAIDAAGNTAAAEQLVTVEDVEAPALTVPAGMSVDATSPAGAVVSYSATVTDNVGVASLACAPASGTTFAIGTTTVTCTAADAAGNDAAASFDVVVRGAVDQLVDLVASLADQSLKAKAQAAGAAAGRGATTAACNQLDALLNHVDAQEGKKVAAAEADAIRQRVAAIQGVLGC